MLSDISGMKVYEFELEKGYQATNKIGSVKYQ